MPLIHKCKYPIVDPDPDMGKCIQNFTVKDWSVVGAWGSAGYAVGWYVNYPLVKWQYFNIIMYIPLQIHV